MKTVSQERGVDTHGTDLQYDTKDNIRIHTCRRGHICVYVYYLNTIVNFVLWREFGAIQKSTQELM